MIEFNLVVTQPHADGALIAGAVAEVVYLAKSDGTPIRPSWRQTRPVAVFGYGPKEPTHFELPDLGYYSVTLRLPRGKDIQQDLKVETADSQDHEIILPVSPHEYLSWQQYAGRVKAPTLRNEPIRAPEMASVAAKSVARAMNAVIVRDLDFFDRRGETPATKAVHLSGGVNEWRCIDPDAATLSNLGDYDLGYLASDEFYYYWNPALPGHGQMDEMLNRIAQPASSFDGPAMFPRWIVIDRDGQQDLISIPWMWWGYSEQTGQEKIQILYDRLTASPMTPDAPGRTQISVVDQHWSGLLEFVSSGRLLEVAQLATEIFKHEPPEQALWGKRKSPLIATLGGLALVAASPDRGEQHWDSWLHNLAEWNPGLPDGAVLLGYRLLQLGQYDEARHWLHEGLRRGIPWFSLVVRILRLGLAQLEDDEGLAHIARISARVDSDQAFTVIRLPESE
ncbi:hypothetical protein [Ruegeria meonggei]|uniref:hypothetical protein n=1 Tax=Ruegeria meonggei TaxID=1446476 RepID=UPI00366D47DE